MKGILCAIIGIIIIIVINVGYRQYTTLGYTPFDSTPPDYTTSGTDTYLVVDISGGPSATSYPVTKLSDVPDGGWSEEYKTIKLVFRKITLRDVPGTDITLTKDYYVGVFEVTQAQWQAIMGENPSYFEGDLSRPVEEISWYDCQDFIEKLNARADIKSAGITFRLPTSKEWEYACRAGSTGEYGLLSDGREGTLVEMGWYDDNSGDETHPVGQKKPNAWGLYDMHGNVWEWTASEYDSRCIIRGGSLDDGAENCGTGNRYDVLGYALQNLTLNQLEVEVYSGSPDDVGYDTGFRLAASRTETSVKEIIETMVQIPGKDYLMGKNEVTQAQWQLIMGENPSSFTGDLSRPVECVSWNVCQEFIEKLNACLEVKSAGITFRLPTEEEWEYSCRAGSTGEYGLLSEGREGALEEMGWYDNNSGGKTHPVGQKKPNAWGLYDMHGNVWEWTASEYDSRRIIRGGCCYSLAEDCEADSMNCDYDPDIMDDDLGFRLAASRTETSVKEIIETMVQIPGEDYLMGKYEVTQVQWQLIMGENPSRFKGDLSRPVERISWNDCQEFIEKLNACSEVKSARITFRLPTEEEWEYACRAGSTGKYGLLLDGREGTLDEMGWYDDNSGGKTHPVGLKKPNAWGLYDMHGNVWEWTASEDNSRRIYIGGGWLDDAVVCETGNWSNYYRDGWGFNLGFRLAASRTEK